MSFQLSWLLELSQFLLDVALNAELKGMTARGQLQGHCVEKIGVEIMMALSLCAGERPQVKARLTDHGGCREMHVLDAPLSLLRDQPEHEGKRVVPRVTF